jgi:hypothetical protein
MAEKGRIGHGTIGSGRAALELDGVDAGWLASVSGGDAEGVVVSETGTDGVIRKHIGGVRYTDIELSVNVPLRPPLSDWVAGTIGQKRVGRNGAIRFVDADLREIARLDFSNALIREVTFQPLDAASKEPARVTMKLAPESTRRLKGTGQPIMPSVPVQRPIARASNFRLSIEGLDCKRVASIGPITIKQQIVETGAGGGRVRLEPGGSLDIGELAVAVAGDSPDFIAWHNEFVVVGSPSASEKTGTLELLAPDLKTAVSRLTFAGLGIFNLQHETGEAERLPRLRASMYCEEVGLAPGDLSGH